jgi:hypothetical protein
MIEYCRANCVDSDLEAYWSESAKECIFSGGRADSNRRRRLEDALYRSEYLDQLMLQRRGIDTSSVPALHPCARRWIEEVEFGKKNLGRILWDKIEAFKTAERERHGPMVDCWTGEKKTAKLILDHYAELRGFAERKLEVRGLQGGGRAWCKEKPSGLIFYCWVDVGGLSGAGARLPLHFHVSHVEDNLRPCGAGPDTMYVGADYYAVFKTPENAVYGIFALIEIFDAFASTFA